MKQRFRPFTVLLTAAVLILPCLEVARAEVSQETLKSISTPDKVETPIGTMEFFDGVPTDATVETVYDNLDRMRGVTAFLDNVGALSVYSVIAGNAGIGIAQPQSDRGRRATAQFGVPLPDRQHLDPCTPSVIST